LHIPSSQQLADFLAGICAFLFFWQQLCVPDATAGAGTNAEQATSNANTMAQKRMA
jgi:hypothetical protein